MPDITRTVTATDWSYSVDLTQGPGQFRADYVDDAMFPTEHTLSQAMAGDRIKIYALAQGNYALLGDFVIDEYTLSETADGVTGHLSGRDAKALLLERYPSFDPARRNTAHILRSESGSTTYVGMSVASDGAITYNATAVEALNDIVARAGFTPQVNIDDYAIGNPDFVHSTDMNFSQAIEGILEPLRTGHTEKTRADVYVRGDTIYV